MRILAIHAGMHDSSAAAFDDYELVAAVSEERMTRVKGSGEKVPWLSIDEVLRIAGWRRNDVDAIATTRGWFPTHDYRFSLPRELWYTLKRWQGKERTHRELAVLSHRFGITDTHKLFRADRFLKDNSFRPDTQIYFANHHASHALAALFYTDWNEALVYTSDGIGDNVSYSMRGLKNGALECFYGDDRWLTKTLKETGLASAYGYATVACGFRMLRHEGKLTGLAAYGEPKLAERDGGAVPLQRQDGTDRDRFQELVRDAREVPRPLQGA